MDVRRLSSTVISQGKYTTSCPSKIQCPRRALGGQTRQGHALDERDAPAAWQAELEKTMIELGFRQVVSSRCLYYHPSLGIRVVEHVDDFDVR